MPETPRTNTPLISDGEIWDIEVIGNRAYYVGSFSSVRNNAPGNTTNYPTRRQIVAFNLTDRPRRRHLQPDHHRLARRGRGQP